MIENVLFNGLDEISEDVKMIVDETSFRKSKVCICIYIYGFVCRRIFFYIEFFGSDLLIIILGKLNGLNIRNFFNNIIICIDIFLYVLFCRSSKKRRRRN